MPNELTLADTYKDLTGEIGVFLGAGRGADNGDVAWDDDTTTKIKSFVKSGLRQFYFPPPDQSGHSHSWSFLRPYAELTLVSGENTLRLPFDFGALFGPIHVVGSSTTRSARLTPSGQARAMYSLYPDTEGFPRYIEIETVKQSNPYLPPASQLVVFPIPDQDYTIGLNYEIIPDMLSGNLPYAYGGVEHAETLLESCLAVAEERLDDVRGVHSQKFRELLAASISRDRGRQPQTHGYNGDYSDAMSLNSGHSRYIANWPTITVNGVIPGES